MLVIFGKVNITFTSHLNALPLINTITLRKSMVFQGMLDKLMK